MVLDSELVIRVIPGDGAFGEPLAGSFGLRLFRGLPHHLNADRHLRVVGFMLEMLRIDTELLPTGGRVRATRRNSVLALVQIHFNRGTS